MKASRSKRAATGIVAVIGLYGIVYFLSTEVFLGRLNLTRYRIRLFQSEMHLRAFQPLCFLESLVSSRDYEFSTQVRNHASLPPSE